LKPNFNLFSNLEKYRESVEGCRLAAGQPEVSAGKQHHETKIDQ